MDARHNKDLSRLARDILDNARNRLLVNLRYMDTALTFSGREEYEGSVSVNGRSLYYDPLFILRSYKDAAENVNRLYLHSVLHCIFCHPFGCESMERRHWDLACDLAAEAVILELDLPCTRTGGDGKKRDMLRKIRRETGFLTAEKIYASLRTGGLKEADSKEKLTALEALFKADDHSLWYATEEKAVTDADAASERIHMPLNDSGLSEEWKEIAERIGMEIETFAKVKGRYASSLVQNLRSVTREKYDYTSFLKKFASMNESVKVSDDEFDYIYYNYGLTQYKKMPLIEPLEYREDSKIKDFVIAIDTSGSVAGKEVQSFIEKTYNILKSRESFRQKINVHIVQCDAEVQSDIVITSEAELEKYIAAMEIRGHGGTDFRPVFEHVDRLLTDGEFSDLKGLIYFTDGLGTYPAYKPAYKTAFVFVESGYNIPDVPVWAMRVVLDPDEI
ncbi:MAG: VWA domain-containing protein [Mogibacterium sp.]|nr:VWA domain-containing protein [Mogibacterium sp.]